MARSLSDAHTLLDVPQDPLDALHILVSRWQLPEPDAQTARTLIEKARVQQYNTASTVRSTSPLSFSYLNRASPPFDVSFPLSYRSSYDPVYQATRHVTPVHTPIAALPDDILLHIFEYVAGERSSEPSKRLSWLVITFICRYWRHIATASASLWNYIPVRSSDILLTFVKRTKDLPLDLVFEGGTSKAAMLAAARRISIYTLGPRIRSLEFLDRSTNWLEFARCLPTHMPRLEVLQLDGVEHRTEHPAHTPVGHILGDDAPALHTLFVTGCSFLPELYPKCARVTNLRLARNANSLTPDAILDILSSFPNLQTFHFEMPAQSEDAVPFVAHKHAQVHLPALKALTIVHVPSATVHILAHLAIPERAAVSLAFPTAEGTLLADHADIFAHIHEISKFTHLTIVVQEKVGKVCMHAGFSHADRRFCLQYRRDYNFSQHFHHLAHIMPSLTSLTVDLDAQRQCRSIISSISETNWRRFLVGLPCVSELRVSSNYSFSHRALFRVLREAVVSADGEPAPVLPALRTLQLADLVLSEDRCDCGCMEDGAFPGTYGACARVSVHEFYTHKDAWDYDYEHIDNAALWIEGLRRCLQGRWTPDVPPLRVRLTAGSFKKWRSSSCHHAEIAKAVTGLVDRLEFAPPGN